MGKDGDELVKNRLLTSLYGDLTKKELHKFGLLGLTFMCLIGSYWLLRPLKDAVFFSIVGGKQFQPIAKILSVVVVIGVVLVYSKLVDIFSRTTLFYLVMAFYTCSFWILACFLAHPEIGLANTSPDPSRLVGWVTYFLIESYGSLSVSMFWSFVSSCTDSTSASRGYSMIVGGAQVGSIAGPLLAANAQVLGVVPLFGVAGCFVGLVGVLLRSFVVNVGATEPVQVDAAVEKGEANDKHNRNQQSGFFEGLKLIAGQPYILGIALVSTLYEVIATITDYQMKVLAHETAADAAALASFLGAFGMTANGLALVTALLFSSFAIRRFGLRWCLIAYPLAVAIASFILLLFSTSAPTTLLNVFFFVMVITKGLSYALNNPAKEMLYIPTSKAVKYKAKSWIDLFGGRAAKATGSSITSVLKGLATAESMVQAGVAISFGIVGIWLLIASRVGFQHASLTANNQIIE